MTMSSMTHGLQQSNGFGYLAAKSRSVIRTSVVCSIAVFLVLPTLLVIAMSLTSESYIHFPPQDISTRWYAAYFGDPRWMRATFLSLRIAVGTMAAATVIGTMASLAFVRGSLPGSELIRVLSLSPLITPGIITAVAVYLAFSPLRLTDNYFGFVIAHTVLAIPYVVLVITASLVSFDSDIELAALNCGASRLRSFFEVILPNIAPGVVSAAVFAFLTSFDEATVAIFIAGADQQTLPSKLFEDINNTLTPVIPAVSTTMVVFSLTLMGLLVAGLRFFKKRT
jgi:mannopine transport system permease protein